MISKKDAKPFLIKTAIGTAKTTKAEMLYDDEWQVVYGLVGDPVGYLQYREYGNELVFDKVLVLNANSTSRMIDYDTKIMIDDMPTKNYRNGDYTIKYIYPERNNEIVIGLTKVKAVNMPKLYFERNGQILFMQVNFDNEALSAYAKRNTKLPIEAGDYVWTREPADATSTKNRLRLNSISSVGFDEHYKPFSILEFVNE